MTEQQINFLDKQILKQREAEYLEFLQKKVSDGYEAKQMLLKWSIDKYG